ncbi:PrnA protein [Pyrenophora tritici-repentis Pt-1C-BFP]|uniref:PrnA protein n=1 Tax=Pyrenophora tritici-repentis (strain Pt-1C-BFP) TaxID=426418 RepID=B2W7V5_PYRTR|nr:PrnA protein [Pyrenophora tritici-repentis Pt-1C-BFP]EDU48813.1 PrnA protein [Pyrenophora tritici-repentis Pt-1C-BFP]
MESENPRPTKKRHLAAEERQRAVRARCRHLRRQCQFSNAPATVEKRAPDIATSFKEVMDRLQCMEYILKHHFPNLGLDIDSLRRMCDTLTLSTTQPATSTSLDPLGDEQPTESPGIEDEDCTVEYVDNTTAHYSGEFSHWNFSMHIKRNIDELMARSNVPRLDKENRVPAFMRVGEADPDSTSMADIVTILPPRPVATFLINVFFKHATSIYYYVDRAWLDSVLDRIYANLNGLRSKDITAACVVLMVLAVGTQYVHLDSPRQHSRGSVDAVMNPDSGSSWELDIGSAFYRQVAKLLSEVIHSGSLLSVQVFLLLGLYNLPIDASGLGYIYLNMAIKLAIQNGMHRKASRSVFDSSTKEIRRRIWWTTYCMERYDDLTADFIGVDRGSERLEAIREMASVGDSARSEVSLIETLEAALHRLHMFDSSPKEPTYQAGGLEQDGYEGLVNWYTRLRDSAMSRGRHPTYNGESAEVARPQNPVRVTQPRPNRNGQAATGIPHDFSIENFPFDFDLLNSDGNVAFFTPDLNEHGGPERELFENLMWMPK